MKLITTFTLLLFTSLLYAQKKAIIIYAANDNKPLVNVLIYHKANLIAESNKYGEVTLQLDNIDSLTFIKNEYEDIILAKTQLANKISMHKNQVITLNEVIISPMTPEKLLKKINDFVENKDENGNQKTQSNYSLPNNIQVYNKFMANNDTLHYLNNRFLYGNGTFKINNQTKAVKNFINVKTEKNIYQTYSWNENKTNFYDMFTIIPLGIGYDDFSNVIKYQKKFEFKISENDLYYKLEFKQKKKIGWCNIEGYLIVDKYDYGIYEFESTLLDNKPFSRKVMNFSTMKPTGFKILKESYHFKYTKLNDQYILDNCSKNTIFTAESVSLKNTSFVSTVQIEKTNNFSDKDLKNFNMFNWDIK